MSPDRVNVEVEGRVLSLSNLDKVLFPDAGFTKGAVIDYYSRIADAMVPHTRNRPVTLVRLPNGVDGQRFFEKNVSRSAPPWLPTVSVPAESRRKAANGEGSGTVTYGIVSDRPSLVWAANLAAIEIHVPLWHVDSSRSVPADPDFVVFDLDPGPGTSIVECAAVATWVRERLVAAGLEPFAKTSGSKGLQLYARVRRLSWSDTRDLSHDLALALEREHDELVVSNMRKDLRAGRILIDWSQNHPAKTTVAVYSLRARPQPAVSTPVTWDEVLACLKEEDPSLLSFTSDEVVRRFELLGDLFRALTIS